MEIRKPRLTLPPEPPESVHRWVRREQFDDSSLERPELFPALPGESADDPAIELDDHPEVREAWDAYIEGRWWPWAEQDRRERAVQTVCHALATDRPARTRDQSCGAGAQGASAHDPRTARRISPRYLSCCSATTAMLYSRWRSPFKGSRLGRTPGLRRGVRPRSGNSNATWIGSADVRPRC